jgi:parallel beta-helix repeat protein
MLLIGLLLISGTIIYFSLGEGSPTTKTESSPESISVSITPSDSMQLTVNKTQIFTANANTTDLALSYTWLIENSSKTIAVNGTDYLLISNGNEATFKFLKEEMGSCWLSVLANSPILSSMSTVTIQCISQPIKVNTPVGNEPTTDQPTQTPNQNNFATNNNVPLIINYIVQPFDNNQYQVIDGINGNVLSKYTTSSANTTLNSAIALGGTIVIREGNYSGAQLIVPSNVAIIAESGTTGIEYASIADGATINEPNFNAAFGNYTSGSYTIATNMTASATDDTWYLAFKPDNSIFFTSNNATTVAQTVVNRASNGSVIFLKAGSYPIYPSLDIINKTDLTVTGDKTAVLMCNGSDNIIHLRRSARITINNIELDGNKAAFAFGGNASRQHGIYFDLTNDTKVSDLYIHNVFGVGILGVGRENLVRGLTVQNCRFEDNGDPGSPSRGGIYTYYVHKVSVTDSIFIRDYSIHVAFCGSETYKTIFADFFCSRNRMYRTIDSGDSPAVDVLFGSNFTISYNKIYNSYTTGNSADGIRVEMSHNGFVIGNTVQNNWVGIYVYVNSYNIQVINNNVSNNRFRGIIVQSSNSITVYSNTITNNTGWGITVSDNCNNTRIFNNTLSGNAFYYRTSQIAFANIGTNVSFIENGGLITENSISGTNDTATSITLEHGLIDNPTNVTCSFDTTAITDYSWSSMSNQITITVNSTTPLPPIWTAYVKVNWQP